LLDVAVSPDQRWAAELLRDSRLDSEQLRVNSSDGTVLQADAPLPIKEFGVSPRGKRLAFSLGGKTLSVLDLDVTSAPRTLDFMAIRRLAFWDDDQIVLELPRETWLVDARDGSHRQITLRSSEHFFARGRSGVIVATGYSGEAITYDARDRPLQSFYKFAPVALSPSGEWLLLRGEGRLVLASTKEGIRTLLLTERTDVELWRFSHDEQRLATLGAAGLVVWDTAAGNKWNVSARAPLGNVTSLEFDETSDVVVLGVADGTASAFRYQSSERVPVPAIGRAAQDESAIRWSQASGALRAFRRGDGKWLGALALTSGGARGFVSSENGEIDFLGGEPVTAPRCAFGSLLAAWPVCSDALRVPGLLARWLRD
jgi:WD40 repeat protein